MNKASCLAEVLGDIDSLITCMDFPKVYHKEIEWHMEARQSELRGIASNLTGFGEQNIDQGTIDKINRLLVKYRNDNVKGFTTFKSWPSIWLNECRVRTRKVERSLVQVSNDIHINVYVLDYINKLSALFFLLALYYNK